MIAPTRLARLAPFAEASPAMLATLARLAVEKRFRTGETLFRAGEDPRGWYVVMEGAVRVVRTTESRQHVVHAEGPGGTLGEVPLFGGGTLPATAIATAPTTCLLFTRTAIARALREHPDLAFVLLARLALRIRTLLDRLDGRSALTVRARLAEFILARTGPDGVAVLGMSQEALAEELGTVREVVSRELVGLRREGLVSAQGRGRMKVLDPAALLQCARSSPGG